jgi:hypothetical protein|tara:strand:- start:63 stop:569 length:507 start_codon:yes stop_codon:yes gene_type:complete
MKIQVIDNFFDDYYRIEPEIKKIKLYNNQDFNNTFKVTQQWPGFRSESIHTYNPILFHLFIKEFKEKFSWQIPFALELYLHLRLKEDQVKDWIHKDEGVQLGILVYLNDNLESGTNFYQDNSETPCATINMVKNRAVLFDSQTNHKSMMNFGNGLEDGRLTLNGFINF